jgi:uncharacterized Zn-finger protein
MYENVMTNLTVDKTQAIPITKKQLPLCCPPVGSSDHWSMHPRVYLPLDDQDHTQVTCPYCGAHYEFKSV